jgi:hypothetical protein
MFPKGRRWMLALLLLLGCGDKTDVKISDAPPAETAAPG